MSSPHRLRQLSAFTVISLLLALSRPVTAGPPAPAAPAAETVLGSALPQNCSGPLAPAPCVRGYVYYDGAPAAGASVTLESEFGELVVVTADGSASDFPYFQATLGGPPLLASVNDAITLTASLNGSAATVAYTIVTGGQQVDVVIAASPLFGSGADGELVVTSESYADNDRSRLISRADAGQPNISVASVSSFSVGDEILVIQMQGDGVGLHEFKFITDISGTVLTAHSNLANNYAILGDANAQVVRVAHYTDVTVLGAGSLQAHPWNGNNGAVVVFRASGSLNIGPGANLNAGGQGFRGGTGSNSKVGVAAGDATRAEGTDGLGGDEGLSANGNGGGAGSGADAGSGGGGGGYASAGEQGDSDQGTGGAGGEAVGSADLSLLISGGGGGGGRGESNANCVPSDTYHGGHGAIGGGIIIVAAKLITVTGEMASDGNDGGDSNGGCEEGAGGGGGGAGGSIHLVSLAQTIGNGLVHALGGARGAGSGNFMHYGGSGADGRLRLSSENFSGTTSPAASTSQLVFPEQPIPTINSVRPTNAIQGVDTLTFLGTAASPNLNGASITAYVWRSDVAGVLSTQASFTRTAANLTAGTHVIYFKARDNHNVWSEEISRTITVLPLAGQNGLYLPLLHWQSAAGFPGTSEIEPNNTLAQANGPIASGVNYQGFQNDSSDYFSFQSAGGNIGVILSSTSAPGTQLYLYYQSTANLVGHDGHIGNPPYQINITGAAGWYYVRITAGTPFNNTTPYTLRVMYP